jgi:DNA invertase Pin-like site-specific DNA recombinase
MNIYGYVRVSALDQCEDRQLIAMQGLAIPSAQIFMDKQSGKDFQRKAYIALSQKLQAGDRLVVQSVDRLGRDYEEIQNQWRILTKERGVHIAVLDMPLLDTRGGKGLQDKFLSDIVLLVQSFAAQNERENIRKRQREGIAAARARGVRFGRPLKNPPANFAALVRQWEEGALSFKEVLALTGLKQATFYNRLREHRATEGQAMDFSKAHRNDSLRGSFQYRSGAAGMDAPGTQAAKDRGESAPEPLASQANSKNPEDFAEAVRKWEQGAISFQEALKQTGFKAAMFYNRLREFRASAVPEQGDTLKGTRAVAEGF